MYLNTHRLNQTYGHCHRQRHWDSCVWLIYGWTSNQGFNQENDFPTGLCSMKNVSVLPCSRWQVGYLAQSIGIGATLANVNMLESASSSTHLLNIISWIPQREAKHSILPTMVLLYFQKLSSFLCDRSPQPNYLAPNLSSALHQLWDSVSHLISKTRIIIVLTS